MRKELEEELEAGDRAVKDLISHMERMGAGGMTTPPTMGQDGVFWEVTIKRLGGISESRHD